ncbi:uncharacterized protein LOC125267170 [Megalobrama amblycephala]|uniref:uncharacterized protein LOC125267170 n=1 Tax=Megalobrama amblycephala TaxID=75352 RepID=UPI00201415C6|nr:uncharacterized protein LOC125267170 [Megalobrama amblycephala]
MPNIIPRHKIKGVDFCGSHFHHYIIRSDLGCYMRSSDCTAGSDLSIHDLHPACQNGDHYFADENNQFYIIKGKSYRRVMNLTTDTESAVFSLHPNCQGGDHYLAAFDWFYIIFQDKGTYRRTKDLSQDSHSEEFPLHDNCRNGLYYWGLPDHYYFLKPASEWGVEYYRGNDFQEDSCVAVCSVHPDVLNFLPGGLSITNGPAFRKWDNIQTVSNESPTPVTMQKKVTKKVGYNKEKMSQITQNWKIEKSAKITSGKLARLVLKCQFSFSTEYGGAVVNVEKESWNEETEVEEQLSFELKPNQCFNLWQYQLGLGSEPVLFCRDLKITDQPYRPCGLPLGM